MLFVVDPVSKKGSTFFLFCVVILLARISSCQANDQPVIGILAQSTGSGQLSQLGSYYIAASYVKWIESAGARVVPLWYANYSSTELISILTSLNGVLLPGGGASYTGLYKESLQIIYNFTQNSNDNGFYFPLWGTCQGFEQLMILTSRNDTILTHFDSENYTVPLQMTITKNTTLWNSLPETTVDTLMKYPVTMNNHQYGISPKNFADSELLSNYYKVLSVNQDRKNVTFVSTVEGRKYPVWGTQWHPEKNQFEWNHEVINHSADAIVAMQSMANFFVDKARLSMSSFSGSKTKLESNLLASKYLIYNYPAIYTGLLLPGEDFIQCYFSS